MEINLETEESVLLVVDGNCNFKVWGRRNEEGTMVIEHVRYDANCVDCEVKE